MRQGRSLWRSRWLRRVVTVFHVFLLVALPALVVLIVADVRHFARNHESALAVVVRREENCGAPRGGGSDAPPCVIDVKYSFVTAAGRAIEKTETELYAFSKTRRVGELITVYYDPDNPRDARLHAGWSGTLISIIVTITAFWLVLIGLGFYRLTVVKT